MISSRSKPSIVRYMAFCTASGRLEDSPCRYISSVSSPQGSTNTGWRSFSLKRTTLSSMEGQYRGPTPWMSPP